MLLKFLSGMIGCISVYGLYCDYQNRQSFKNNFLFVYELDNKKMIEGEIINNLSGEHPLHRIDANIKRKTIYYEPYFNQKNNTNFFTPKTHIFEYWDNKNKLNFISSNINFNDFRIFFEKNAKIHYTNYKICNMSSDGMTVEKFIPSKSLITIFGSFEQKEIPHYCVEFLGPKRKVLNDIAFKYFNISNEFTFLLMSCTIVSFYFLIK